MVGRVVDGAGRAQYPSNLVACPYVGTTYDCSQKIVQPTGPFGFAVLKLDKSVRYHLFATVTNPNPPWPCPVLIGGPDIVYLSNESFDGLPNELPQLAKFTVVKPSPSDCAPITVVDDAGNPVPGAGLFVNGDPGNGVTNSQGIIQVKVTPGATYEIGAYLPNSGWPCPAYASPDGSTFHFSERRTVTAEQLSAGATTFVIPKPTVYDCVEVTVTDDAGNPAPGAGLFVDEGFGPGLTDSQGVIRLDVEPAGVYELGAFLSNSGWPCPGYISPDGSSFHFSEPRSVSAEELLDGETFVIRKPSAYDCVEVTVTDDAGNPLPGAGLFVDDGFGPDSPTRKVSSTSMSSLPLSMSSGRSCRIRGGHARATSPRTDRRSTSPSDVRCRPRSCSTGKPS